MTIGQVIRTYRVQKGMTQEEMAGRLGVTAPAVNKWEKEKSLPDVTMLAPIARLLGISTDTLLSYREELSPQEIAAIIEKMVIDSKTKPFQEIVNDVKRRAAEYPNCDALLCQMASILDAQRIIQHVPEDEQQDAFICSLFERVLFSQNEQIRCAAADALMGFYRRKGQVDRAEKYLDYFSDQNPEKKRKRAQICAESGRIEEAYKAYEEGLFADFQRLNMTLQGMFDLAKEADDHEKMRFLVEKQELLARCFDMGPYYEAFGRINLASVMKDEQTARTVMQEVLEALPEMDASQHSPLYAHMTFKPMTEDFKKELRENLIRGFEEEFGPLDKDI